MAARSSTQVRSTAAADDAEQWAGTALEAALQARAPGVHASTPMVRQLALQVARELGLDRRAQARLDLAVRVRDVGMIGLPDSVALATTPLTPAEGTDRARIEASGVSSERMRPGALPFIGREEELAWLESRRARIAGVLPPIVLHHQRES